MAFNANDANALLTLLTNQLGQGPIDFDSDEGKEILRLLSDLDAAQGLQSNISDINNFDRLLDIYERRMALAKLRGEVLGEEQKATKTMSIIRQRHVNQLTKRLKLLLTSNESNQQEIQNLQEEILIQKKILKLEKNIQKGEQKGNQIASDLLQSFTGIKSSFLGGKGPKGMMMGLKGLSKGFLKGVGARMHPIVLLITFIQDVIESMMAIDAGAAEFFSKTGMGGFTVDIANLNRSFVDIYGSQAIGLANEALAGIARARPDIIKLRTARLNLAKDVMRYTFVGASAEALLDLSSFFDINLKYTADQQRLINRRIFDFAQNIDRPPREVFNEMATSLPTLGRFGRDFPRIFFDLSRVAREAGLKVSDLNQLVEDQDIASNVLKATAKFNALLGGQFINPGELLSAKPDEKVKLIKDAYDRARARGIKIPQRLVRDLYKQFGLNASQFRKITGASFEGLSAEADAFMQQPVTDEDIMRETFRKGLSATDKLLNSVKRLAAEAAHIVFKLLPRVFDSILRLAGVDSMMFNFKDDTIAQRKRMMATMAAQEKQLEQKTFEDIIKANADFMSGNLDFEEYNDRLVTAGVGRTRAAQKARDAFVRQKNTNAGVPKFLARIGDPSRVRTPAFDALTQPSNVIQSSGYPAMTDFSPNARKMEDAMVTHVTPNMGLAKDYPIEEKKFETSDQDGVLLSRLAKLRDSLYLLNEKNTKIKLNVGQTKIAEAIA